MLLGVYVMPGSDRHAYMSRVASFGLEWQYWSQTRGHAVFSWRACAAADWSLACAGAGAPGCGCDQGDSAGAIAASGALCCALAGTSAPAQKSRSKAGPRRVAALLPGRRAVVRNCTAHGRQAMGLGNAAPRTSDDTTHPRRNGGAPLNAGGHGQCCFPSRPAQALSPACAGAASGVSGKLNACCVAQGAGPALQASTRGTRGAARVVPHVTRRACAVGTAAHVSASCRKHRPAA